MKNFIKKWIWVPVVTFLLFLIGGRGREYRDRQEQIKKREKEVVERERELEELEESDPFDVYEEVKANHDEAIRKAKEKEGRPPITSVDDARDYLDGLLDKLRE